MNYEIVVLHGKDGQEDIIYEEGFEDDEGDEIQEEEESLLPFVNLEGFIFVCGNCGEQCEVELEGRQIIVNCFNCHP